MEKKLIFLDIDGTLVDEKEKVAETAIYACQQARKNGHKIYLCTGRSKPEIFPHILAIGFDGIIGAGGGYIESDGKVLYHKKVSKQQVQHMVDYFNQQQIDFYLESNGGLFASHNLRPRLELLFYGQEGVKGERHPFMEALIFGEKNLYRDDVNKVCFLENPAIDFKKIKQEFDGEFEVIQCTVPAFGKNSGEMMVPGIHKATAIDFLLKHLKHPQNQTLAIGDGLNDLEMFAYCDIGIAVGTAHQELKARADFVTTAPSEDGLLHAFESYHLI